MWKREVAGLGLGDHSRSGAVHDVIDALGDSLWPRERVVRRFVSFTTYNDELKIHFLP